MKRLIKAGLMVLLGAAIWMNGGVVKVASAEPWGNGICKAGWNVTYDSGDTYCVLPGGSCQYHPSGSLPACAQDQPNNPKPVVKKPSSYGAVAWSIQNRKLGISSRQATKQASISAAMKQCGDATCVVSATYSNSCIALGYGESKSPVKTGQYIWFAEGGLTSETKSIEKMLRICNKVAKNCQVTFSECSLP